MIPHHNSYNMYTFARFHALSLFTVSFTLISQQISKHRQFNSTMTSKIMNTTLSSRVYVSFNWSNIDIFFIMEVTQNVENT